MAQINNSDVIQKLVDELQLYPGKDVIPSELAEKILPVFQINSETITVSPTPANIVESGEQEGAGSTTLYTTPSTGKFYLTNAALSGFNALTTDGTECQISVVIDGTRKNIFNLSCAQFTAGNAYQNSAVSFNFQNPILIDAGTTILITSVANLNAYGSIIGYTEAD